MKFTKLQDQHYPDEQDANEALAETQYWIIREAINDVRNSESPLSYNGLAWAIVDAVGFPNGWESLKKALQEVETISQKAYTQEYEKQVKAKLPF
jgi:hypothetical protein